MRLSFRRRSPRDHFRIESIEEQSTSFLVRQGAHCRPFSLCHLPEYDKHVALSTGSRGPAIYRRLEYRENEYRR